MAQRTLIDAAGKVVNVIEIDAAVAFAPPQGLVLGPAGGRIGDTWDGHAYASPAVPPPTAAELAPVIRAEFDRRIASAFAGKRNSILSYAVKLNGLVSIGLAAGKTIQQSLTAEQQADVTLIWALDDWESAMIDAREALIAAVAGRSGAGADAAADLSFADDSHWPAAPAGLTAQWLAGF